MQRSVLLVDDEKSVCSALKRIFRKTPYTVYEASNGQQALRLLEKVNVDIIISDQRMPGMNGSELLSIVKAQYPLIERIMLSGYTDFEALTSAINEASIFKFLLKPWDEEELLNTINAAARHKQEAKHKSSNSIANTTVSIAARKNKHDITNAHTVLPTSDSLCIVDLQQQKRKPSINIEATESQAPIKNSKKTINSQLFIDHLDKQLANTRDDFKNDLLKGEFHIAESTLISQQSHASSGLLHYYLLHWPRRPQFDHQHIVGTAKQNKHTEQLALNYLLKLERHFSQRHEKIHSIKPESHFNHSIVIDIFCDELITNTDLKKHLFSLKEYGQLVLRIPFASIDKDFLPELLESTYIHNAALMLSIEKRIVDIEKLQNINIRYLEMDARHSTIRNPLITQKRINMLNQTQNSGIETILSEVNDTEQWNYAKTLNIDFLSSALDQPQA